MVKSVDIAVIDYGMGNLHSIAKALRYVAPQRTVWVGADPDIISTASHVIYPGVGAIKDCVKELKTRGLDQIIKEVSKSKPLLGICVGMQVLATKGYENKETEGLNWIRGSVKKIITIPSLPIPQMGWNNLEIKANHPIVKNISENDHTYFVHSYLFEVYDKNQIIASVDYGVPISAIIAKDNIIGMQFHPEKSQQVGLDLISNFLIMG